jgi:teichuronic acid biosynthesis glycosyltransferase TuaH
MFTLENENIICVSYSTWEGPYTKSVVQLMSLLAVKNRILYVEYPFTFKDVFTTLLGKIQAPVGRMLGLRKRCQVKTTPANFQVYNWVIPPLIPVNAVKNDSIYRLLLKIDGHIYRHSLKKAIRKLHFDNPVVIYAYNPIFGDELTGRLNEKISVYYCYDGFPKDWRSLRAWHADRAFSAHADGIIVTSGYLQTQKLELNPHVALVKNGVDFDMFAKSAKTTVSDRVRKRIGYIGSIDDRLDIDFVEYAVGRLPECDWEFTGDLRYPLVKERLIKYDHVRFFPPVNAEKVPSLLSTYDLGIIPYLCDETNKNIYPLKINEYLAAGVPVVVTRFADLQEFSGIVSFASTADEFLDALKNELENDTEEKITARIDFARNNSWSSRADIFAGCLASFIQKKGNKQGNDKNS